MSQETVGIVVVRVGVVHVEVVVIEPVAVAIELAVVIGTEVVGIIVEGAIVVDTTVADIIVVGIIAVEIIDMVIDAITADIIILIVGLIILTIRTIDVIMIGMEDAVFTGHKIAIQSLLAFFLVCATGLGFSTQSFARTSYPLDFRDRGFYFDLPNDYYRAAGPYWIWATNGRVPSRAAVIGFSDGYPVYRCRSRHQGRTFHGRLIPGRFCYIWHRGQRVGMSWYEVFVR